MNCKYGNQKNSLTADTELCVLYRTGSTVRGEWGTAYIRGDLHRRPGHAHEDRDDDAAKRVWPGLQDEPGARRAGVGGAGGTELWEKSRTRQWNRVSQNRTRQRRVGVGSQQIPGLSDCSFVTVWTFLGFPEKRVTCCYPDLLLIFETDGIHFVCGET